MGRFTRSARLALAALVGAVGIPVLVGVGTQAAALDTSTCAPSVNLFTALSGGDGLQLYTHDEPESGIASIPVSQGIGNGWNGRVLTGPNGYVYHLNAAGDVARHRWLPSGAWENGGQSVLVGTGWTGWQTAAQHYRITVDANDHFYTVKPDGKLRWHAYTQTGSTYTWQERELQSGWDRFDQVFAGGKGVLYARAPGEGTGKLYRFVYDHVTNTFTQNNLVVGDGWNGFKQLASGGGDVIYALRTNGELWWYRYRPTQAAWANNPAGAEKTLLAGWWTGVDEFAPAIDACSPSSLATDVVCAPQVDLHSTGASGGLTLNRQEEVEVGYFGRKGAITSIGGGPGWANRVLRGPGGLIYFITPAGELRSHQWSASGWTDGGVSLLKGTGWTGFDQPANRYRITVDAAGDFYWVKDNSELVRSRRDSGGTWTHETLDYGWGRYNQVFAAGNGVIYARDGSIGDGTVYRFHYDVASRRWLDYGTSLSTGWNGFKQLVSPGGDIILGLTGGSGVFWYRWDPAAKLFALSGRGVTKEFLLAWDGANEITADITACTAVAPPTVPAVTPAGPNSERGALVYNPGTQKLDAAYVSDQNQLYLGSQSSQNSPVITFDPALTGPSYTGTPSLAVGSDGALVVAVNATDAQTRTSARTGPITAPWTAAVSQRGTFANSPTLVRGGDGLLSAFAVDGAGKLWWSKQFSATKAFAPWRLAGSTTITADFAVLANGNDFEVVYRTTSNAAAVSKVVNGVASAPRTAAGVTVGSAPAGVVFADGKVQLVVRAADGKLHTQKETASGFTAGWTEIGASQATYAGSPSAILNTHGIVEVAVRGSDGYVYRGGQTVPGSSTWRSWATNLDPAASDPVLAKASGVEQRVFFRDGYGGSYLWYVEAYNSSQQFAAGTRPGTERVEIKSVKGKAPR
ncbi:tachylectin-related carbohydrate-binding protein [Actinokineospora globicatena]|uniref:tachylectin-related carbohydrate-binding protein n=1 Tax=Actinokineospora globicatena TaxID=103729 RepID=UPI0020A2B452|nr:tachylectin-related carbohydrate-binding protein [Actinokineospora globicatena]MCP2300634.1 Tachylectin [Actinokineospora globicatena]GLW81178.1 hypothetical protein Aglo01_56590 [Actinokineospora globicatena]GLW88371.1 hypothetical protein Aglo02_60100 [Actinokineospora globicatena]